LRRTAKVERQKTTLFHFRPAKDDVVVFSPEHEEIRIQAATEGEKELYRREFGVWLRGDGKYFSERNAFTLEPLRMDGVGALEWKGNGDVDRIVLRESEIGWGGGRNEVVIRKADDIFGAAKARGEKAFPDGGRLVRAAFDFYFWGMSKPRNVQVHPPNTLKLGRRCDAAVVQKWLSEKRFRETITAENAGVGPFAEHILSAASPLAVLQTADLAQPKTESET